MFFGVANVWGPIFWEGLGGNRALFGDLRSSLSTAFGRSGPTHVYVYVCICVICDILALPYEHI